MPKVASVTMECTGWSEGIGDVVIEQRNLGVQILHLQIENNEGPLWDQIGIVERPGGAVTVPVNERGEYGLIEVYRAIVAREGAKFPLDGDYSALGRTSVEFPRGFPKGVEAAEDTAVRETLEEVGHPAISAPVKIGEYNQNTTFYPFSIPIFKLKLDTSRSSHLSPEQNEWVGRLKWVTMKQLSGLIASGEIFCGFTLSAYAHMVAAQD